MSKTPLLVIGGIALDITSTMCKSLNPVLYTSTPGKVKQSLGGVGRNVAEAAMRTGANVKLVSVVGNDLAGESILEGMRQLNMTTEYIQSISNESTAVYNAIHSNTGELITAVADMGLFDSMNTSDIIRILNKERPSLVCFDGNIPSELMKDIATECETFSTPVLFEPTSIPKSLKIFDYPETVQQQRIQYVTPNQFELEAMYDCIQAHPILSRKSIRVQQQPRLKGPKLAESILPYALFLSNYVPNVITKLGEEGCLFVNDSTIEYFSPEMIDPTDIKSVTGAGDCFVGTFIANLHYSRQLNLHRMKQIISKSQLSSIRTLKSDGAVSPSIAEDLLVR